MALAYSQPRKARKIKVVLNTNRQPLPFALCASVTRNSHPREARGGAQHRGFYNSQPREARAEGQVFPPPGFTTEGTDNCFSNPLSLFTCICYPCCSGAALLVRSALVGALWVCILILTFFYKCKSQNKNNRATGENLRCF
jgi:hypothetical protein